MLWCSLIHFPFAAWTGLLQMAHGLQGKAEGWRESQTVRASPQQALVSLELQLGEWSWLRSAAVAAGQPAPRLKVRKVAGRPGTVELTVRESQVRFICNRSSLTSLLTAHRQQS
jgi:hypothetical protein